jgi:cytochrome c553
LRNRFQVGAVMLSLAALAACRQDMHDQPKYLPLRPSSFFDDGRSARPIPENTVARGHLDEDRVFYTGRDANGKLVSEFPFPITKEVLLRGQDRFNIYCTPCHDQTGSGNGMVVRRGFRRPPTYHSDRLREIPVGHFYDVITNGLGAMQDYSAQVQPRDRWAIAAYIRALQFSQNAPASELSGDARAQLGPGGGK